MGIINCIGTWIFMGSVAYVGGGSVVLIIVCFLLAVIVGSFFMGIEAASHRAKEIGAKVAVQS